MENQWLMMTYYCPTHGSIEKSEPIELTNEELKRVKTKFNEDKPYND